MKIVVGLLIFGFLFLIYDTLGDQLNSKEDLKGKVKLHGKHEKGGKKGGKKKNNSKKEISKEH